MTRATRSGGLLRRSGGIAVVGESTEQVLEAGESWLIASSTPDDEPPAAVS
jgi:hypothetical protein